MKRLDLVQLCIIIAGIFSVFYFIELIPSFIYYMLSWLSDGLSGGYMMRGFIQNILLLTAYLLFALFTIRSSKQLAEWISNKANLHAEINFALGARELLYALFIILGTYGLIKSIPSLLADSFDYFKDNSHSLLELQMPKPNKGQLFIQFAKTGLYFVLMVYANVFSQFFADKIKNTEPPDEIVPKTD